MLFDIGWPELMLVGVVALVVIGPKDLPRALRVAGFWVRKARTLSREFQNSVDQMIREAELEEIRQDLKKATDFDIEKEFKDTVDPTGELAESIKPPNLPDYFDETSNSLTPAVAEPAPATPDGATPDDAEPELPLGLPPGAAIPAGAPELPLPLPLEAAIPVAAPAPDHEAAPPPPPLS